MTTAPKVIGCALLVNFVVAGSPCWAQSGPISFSFKPQTLFGIPTSGLNTFAAPYRTAAGWGVSFLEPATPNNPLNYSTSAGQGALYYNFFNTLNRMYPTTSGWSVTGNAMALAPGSLQINTYSAVGTAARVGADFALTYLTTMPGPGGAPVSNGNPTVNLHWIQVVSTNNALIGGAPNPGTLSNKVDVAPTNLTSPYYDQGGAANSKNFVDTSGRSAVMFDNNWIAALFLASGPSTPGAAKSPNTITVYNNSGIAWGWQNFFFPNVDEQQFVADVQQDVFGDDLLGQFTVDLNLVTSQAPVIVDLIPTSDYGFYDQAFLASLVPEPSTWVMMLLGFAGLGYVALRRSAKPRLDV